MIARPPEKKFMSKTTIRSSFVMKVANDNHPPKKIFPGWFILLVGLLLCLGAGFWAYEQAVRYYQDATQWWVGEQFLKTDKQKTI